MFDLYGWAHIGQAVFSIFALLGVIVALGCCVKCGYDTEQFLKHSRRVKDGND